MSNMKRHFERHHPDLKRKIEESETKPGKRVKRIDNTPTITDAFRSVVRVEVIAAFRLRNNETNLTIVRCIDYLLNSQLDKIIAFILNHHVRADYFLKKERS